MPRPLPFAVGRRHARWPRVMATPMLVVLLCAFASMAKSADDIAANMVITSDAPGVSVQGAFSHERAHLSRSAQVLHGVGAGAHHATFAADPGRRGYYQVFAWWPEPSQDTGAATVVVHDLRGASAVDVDQRINAGQWNPIGIFELPAAAVRIDITSHAGSGLVVDAVRLQFLSTEQPPLNLTTDELPVAFVGERYFGQLEAFSGEAPYAFAVDASSLPPGLTLDRATGVLSGVPTQLGSYAFDAQVSDRNGQRAQRMLSVEVVLESSGPPTKSRRASERESVPEKDGIASGTPPDLGGLVELVASLREGEWTQASLNAFSDVWTPADLRPLYGLSNPLPSRIIASWSSFAWDPNRGNLMLFGGGHANYSGNDVYRWSGTTRMWERASLPSEILQDDRGNWQAVDGWDAAPASAHTYDNNMFFPHIDRMVVFGGAAFNSGTAFQRELTPTTSRVTGPFFFDPTKANANKVGGTTGSHVMRVAPHPEIVGGNMWANRDMYVNIPNNPVLPGTQINGCTAYADENGSDVAYIGAQSKGGSTNLDLFKYKVSDLANPALDTIQKVGIFWNGTAGRTACGVDPVRNLLVRIGGNTIPFVYWNLATQGPSNKDVRVTPTDPTGEFATLLAQKQINLQDCAFDFDPVRGRFALWCGDGRVWTLTPPPTTSPTGWTIVKQPTPTLATPNGDVGTGLLGKWKYIPNLDAFMGLQDATRGNIWIYKPIGWVNPLGQQPAPSTPNGVSASDGTSSDAVTVIWSAAANATIYTVYRSTTPGVQGASIGTTNSTTLTDVSAVPGTIYYYGVVASGPGGTSVLSVQDSGFRAIAPPAVPSGVDASDGTSSSGVSIKWSAASNATSYTVYRSTSAGTQGDAIGTSATTAFTDTSATPGTVYFYGVTATGPGGTSGLSVQNSGFIGAAGSGDGDLSGSVTASATSVNLSALGALDWANWPPYDHMARGGALISNWTAVGGAAVTSYFGDPRRFSWNDGTPYFTGSRDSGVQAGGIGKGFSFTAPADLSTRTLVIYIGGFNSGGLLTAHVSDGSSSDYSDASLSSTGRYDGVYTLTYRASAPGQQLTVTWTLTSGAGSVSLQSAALFSNAAPPTAIPALVTASDGTSPTNVTIGWVSVPNATSYTIYRSTVAGTPGAPIGTSASATFADTTAQPGVFYYYSVSATGPGGTSGASAQDIGYTLPDAIGGGSLAGAAAFSATSVNLSALDASDWANWPQYNHMASGGGSIGDVAPIAGASITSYFGDPRRFSWNDGTPYFTGNQDFGIQTTGIGKGMNLILPADASVRTATIYVGGSASGGRMVVHLSDGSAADYVDASLSNAARFDGVYTLTYRAAGPGQKLLISWTQASGSGSVSLQSAVLQ